MAQPAPLIGLPEAPVPGDGAAEWVSGDGGRRLRAALFRPGTAARGSIVLSPGRTEPIEKYFEAAGEWLDRGFVVLIHDWRGQGLSDRLLADPLRGHVAGGYRPYLADFRAVLDAFADRLPKPWIAVGHSMGGCLTLLALAEGEDRFAGAVLSAPMLGVRLGRTPEPVARVVARLMTLIGRGGDHVPSGAAVDPYYARFDGNPLTHDARRFGRMTALTKAAPELALGAPTWSWLDFALSADARLARPEVLRKVQTPVTILIAGDDRIVDNAASVAAARRLPRGELVEVPGALHEILMETDEMRNFFQKVLDALTGKVAPAAPVQASEPPAPVPAPDKPRAPAEEATAAEPAAQAPAKTSAAEAATATAPAPAKPAVKRATAKRAEPKRTAPKRVAAETTASAKAEPAAAKPKAASTPAKPKTASTRAKKAPET